MFFEYTHVGLEIKPTIPFGVLVWLLATSYAQNRQCNCVAAERERTVANYARFLSNVREVFRKSPRRRRTQMHIIRRRLIRKQRSHSTALNA